MGRMTRAQAAAGAEVHVDDDVLLDNNINDKVQLATAPDSEGRAPLAEIEPNGAANLRDGDSSESQSENQKPGRKTKGKKGGRKGAKNSSKMDTNALASSTATPPDEPLHVVPDEHESAPSPASKAASDDLMKDQPELDMSHLPLQDIRPKTPQSDAVRLTRSQLRKVPSVEETAEPKPVELRADIEQTQPAIADSSADGGVQIPSDSGAVPGIEPQSTGETEAAVLPVPEDMPNTMQHNRDISSARLSTPTKGKQQSALSDTDEKMMSDSAYDKLEAAAVEAHTPPRSTKTARVFQDDPITALDELDEAVEKVNAEVPNVQPSPQKKSKKPPPVVRTTKASTARISLAHGPKDTPRVPSLGKPRPSTALGESTAKRVTSVSSEKSDDHTADAVEKKEAIIPHSKPRPISMSFPAPKAPVKSSKAPTKSNFQLPGEAVAAKLKAAREARLQKETEDQGKKAFKARPAPAMNKAPTIRQTSASKARESIIGGKPLISSASHKRANSVATTKPAIKPKPLTTSRTGANRMSVVPSNSSTVKVTKRPSTAMATLSNHKTRPSTATALSRPAPRPMSVLATGTKTTKGKEVFNRAANAKSAAEKEKREKEEAAKKARAEAAERGRQASREWAEKQKQRKLGVTKPAPAVDVAEVQFVEPEPEPAVEVPVEAVLAEA